MEQIIIVIGSVLSYIGAKKWIFPLFVQLWDWLVANGRRNIDTSRELKDIEQKANSTYEDQITFLVNQVDHLEKQLQQYSEQLEKLRATILDLNQRLFQKSMTISKLRQLACNNRDCPNRAFCTEDIMIGLDSDN